MREASHPKIANAPSSRAPPSSSQGHSKSAGSEGESGRKRQKTPRAGGGRDVLIGTQRDHEALPLKTNASSENPSRTHAKRARNAMGVSCG